MVEDEIEKRYDIENVGEGDVNKGAYEGDSYDLIRFRER